MIRRRKGGHLVPVPSIFKEEMFDLLRNLRSVSNSNWHLHDMTYLSWGQERPPFMHQLGKHAVRAALLYLPQPAEDRELIVSHPHIRLSLG